MSATLEKTMNVLQARQILRNTRSVPEDRAAAAERVVRAFFAQKPRRQCFVCPSGIWAEHETKAGDDVCWGCAGCHCPASRTIDEVRERQAAERKAADEHLRAADAAAAAAPKPRAVLKERIAALRAAQAELAKLEAAAPVARSRVWDLQATAEAAEAAAEEANATAASGLAAALAEGKTVGPSTAGAKARAALADARDALQVAKSARVLVEERLQAAKSQVDFAFDKVRKGAKATICADRLEDLLTSATEARAEYIIALGQLAWLVREHATPDGDRRAHQLVADGNTPPSAWPESATAGVKVMQDAFEALMSDPAAVI
jgi:hypothetical protein